MSRSYRPMMEFGPHESCGNAQRFATHAEAESSARARFSRWTQPSGYHVAESDDEPNYRWTAAEGDKAC